MSDRDALLAAILANPDDDTPRLVYADWLDEHGGENDRARARFIRLQCEVSRHEFDSPDRRTLEREACQIQSQHGQTWGSELDGIVMAQYTSWSRGFVDEVMMFSKRFVSDGSRIFAAQPVRFVKLVDLGARGAVPPGVLLSCPHFGRLRTVQFVGEPVNDEFAKGLATSPHFGSLVELRLKRCSLTPRGLRTILEAESLPGLRELSLGEFGRSEHLAALARSTAFQRLKTLELWKCLVDEKGVLALARSKYASGLESLRISHDPGVSGHPPMRGPGAVTLAKSPHLRGLRSLALEYQELRKKGTEDFARSYAWPTLRCLSLRSNGILPSALSVLVDNPAFESLEQLDLRGNPIRSRDVEALRQRFPRIAIITDDSRYQMALQHWNEGEA